MRRISKMLGLLVLVTVCILALGSCKNPRKVENLVADFFEVTWDGVEGAEEYVVELDGKEYRTKQTYFELFEYVYPGERVSIRVEPVFALGLREGLWTDTITYTAESVTEGLVYTDLGDGTYAVSCPEDVVLENGELVLPDTYEGALVVELRNSKNETNYMQMSWNGAAESNYNGAAATKIQKIRFSKNLYNIEMGALYKASIEKIYLPEAVSTIGYAALQDCQFLTKVSNASGVRYIENFSFCGCTSLSEFTLPNVIYYIKSGAFIGTGLSKITIPDTIEYLYGYVFYNCSALAEIKFPAKIKKVYPKCFDNTAWYNAQPDGPLYLNNLLYGYKGTMPSGTELVIPESITKIAVDGFFKNQRNLTSITILGKIESIPPDTFSGCSNLKRVILPEGLKKIETNAFHGCKSLEAIALPESMEYIGAQAFSECKGLKTITIPEGVSSLGEGAFYNCALESVKLPKSLLCIWGNPFDVGSGVFEGCTELQEIVLPKNLTKIGARCFYGCTNLQKITIESDVLDVIEADAFLHCTALTELIIPDSVTEFEFSSIAYTNIAHFVFPKNLEWLYDYGPKYKDGMPVDYLVIQKGTKLLDFEWFYIYSNLKTFYFEGTKEEYESIKKMKGQLEIYYPSDASMIKIEKIAAWESALTVYYYSETEPAEEGNYWHYVNGVPVAW